MELRACLFPAFCTSPTSYGVTSKVTLPHDHRLRILGTSLRELRLTGKDHFLFCFSPPLPHLFLTHFLSPPTKSNVPSVPITEKNGMKYPLCRASEPWKWDAGSLSDGQLLEEEMGVGMDLFLQMGLSFFIPSL